LVEIELSVHFSPHFANTFSDVQNPTPSKRIRDFAHRPADYIRRCVAAPLWWDFNTSTDLQNSPSGRKLPSGNLANPPDVGGNFKKTSF
jgi:hypothetical protein